jgi:hypothetical protein
MSAAAGIRFAPGPFKYNGRVAAALVPSLLVAAGLGGRGVMGIFTIGTMLWYIMDAMQYREGAFSVVGEAVLPILPTSSVAIAFVAKDSSVPAAACVMTPCSNNSSASGFSSCVVNPACIPASLPMNGCCERLVIGCEGEE